MFFFFFNFIAAQLVEFDLIESYCFLQDEITSYIDRETEVNQLKQVKRKKLKLQKEQAIILLMGKNVMIKKQGWPSAYATHVRVSLKKMDERSCTVKT